MANYRVGRMPGTLSEITLPDGGEISVRDVLGAAGIDASGYDIRVDGTTLGLDDTVESGASVLLFKKVKGN